MPERSLIDQLDEIVNRMLADPAGRPTSANAELADLIGLVDELRSLPSDAFRDALRRDLERKATMSKPAKAGPEAHQTVTPYLVVDQPIVYLAFLKQAFGAVEQLRTRGTAGGIHAEVRIGDSRVMLGGGEGIAPIPAAIHLYVPDADTTYRTALEAGAESLYAPIDEGYGDREGGVRDASGNFWYIGTHRGAKPIPEGLRAVTPMLHPRGAPELIDFLGRAFGAEELLRVESPQGTVVHAKMKIGDSVVEIGEAHGRFQPMPCMLYLSVEDADALYARAMEAGAESIEEPSKPPYGGRRAGVKDPFGNQWYMASP